MDTIRLQNFRGFKDTGDIELKPLTILLGKNSSGKSSFLRFFPLLKQSIGEHIRGCLAFYGQEVDLGSFKEVKNKFTDDDYIGIGFTLSIPIMSFSYYDEKEHRKEKCVVDVQLKNINETNTIYVSEIKIKTNFCT